MQALAAVNGSATAQTRFLGSCIRSAGAQRTRKGRARRPGLIAASSFANSRKCLTVQLFPLPWRGLLALEPSARRPMPHIDSRGLDSSKILLSELKK